MRIYLKDCHIFLIKSSDKKSSGKIMSFFSGFCSQIFPVWAVGVFYSIVLASHVKEGFIFAKISGF